MFGELDAAERQSGIAQFPLLLVCITRNTQTDREVHVCEDLQLDRVLAVEVGTCRVAVLLGSAVCGEKPPETERNGEVSPQTDY